ncbi:MAG: CPBP family intramembrane metalloprotease [Sandaracinaceae bacterium]|nr:CPBP family intramembrane metalloprotease [Sandaracinaceae bacterium]
MDIEEADEYAVVRPKMRFSAKTAFHVALGAIFIPLAAPLLAWIFVALRLRDDDGVWRKRVLIIAIADTLVVAAFALLMWNNLLALRTQQTRVTPTPIAQPAPAPPRPRIGVRMDPDAPAQPTIRTLSPDGPGAEAHLEVGDQILRVDGAVAGSAASIADTFAATLPGEPRRLQIRRGNETLEIDVVPRTDVSAPPALPVVAMAPRASPRVRGLFDVYEPSDDSWLSSSFTAAKSLALVALTLTLLFVVARRRNAADIAPPATVVLGLAIAMFGSLFGLAFLRSVHLLSAGSSLLVLVAGSTAMLLAASLARRRIGNSETFANPKGTLSTIGIGTLYLMACLIRIAVVLAAILPFTRKAGVGVETVDLPSAASSATGVIPLFIISTAILGPIAEEILFRGVLLPWLRRFMSDTPAVFACAAVFAIGHIFYGLGVLIVLAYGVILGWARIRTGKLYAPIVIHMLINLAMCLIGARR